MSLQLPHQIAANISKFTGRIWLLPHVLKWFEASDNRMFILKGKPGSGKSSLMAWLAGAGPLPADEVAKAQLQQIRSHVKAAHFCIAESGTAPNLVAENVAAQLTRHINGFADALAKSLADRVQIVASVKADVATGSSLTGVHIGHLNLAGLGEELSFDRTFREPIKRLYAGGYQEPIIVLFDALDEAQTYTGAIDLVKLLAKLTDLPAQVRVLVTTRDDPRVFYHHHKVKPLDLITDAPRDSDDVRRYVYERLSEVDNIRRNMLADQIGRASAGVFLYAYLIVNELLEHLPHIPDVESLSLPAELSGLYHTFLNRELGVDRERWFRSFESILGLLAVAQGEGLRRSQIEQITSSDVRETLEVCKQYLEGDLPDGPFRPFHRSLADFLLVDKDNVAYHVDPIQHHHRIVEHYLKTFVASRHQGARRNESGQYWMDCDDYGLRFLPIHLDSAGKFGELFSLVHEDGWYAAKRLFDQSLVAYANDLEHAWRCAERLDTDETQRRQMATHLGQEVHCALALSSLKNMSGDVPPAMLKTLVTKGRWSVSQALSVARNASDVYQRVRAIRVLVPLLLPHERDDVLQEMFADAERAYWPWTRAELRFALAEDLAEHERSRVESETFEAILNIKVQWLRTDTLSAVAHMLSSQFLGRALEAAYQIEPPDNQQKLLAALLPHLNGDQKEEAVALWKRRKVEFPAVLHAAGVSVLPKADRLDALREILGEARHVKDPFWKATSIELLAPYLPADLIPDAVEVARGMDWVNSHHRDSAVEAITKRLIELGNLADAIDVIRSMNIPWRQARLLAAVATCLSEEHAARAVQTAGEINDRYWRDEAIGSLFEFLPQDEQQTALQSALEHSEIEDSDERTLAKAALAIHFAHTNVLAEFHIAQLFDHIKHIHDDLVRSEAIQTVAPLLSEDQLEQAIESAYRRLRYGNR